MAGDGRATSRAAGVAQDRHSRRAGPRRAHRSSAPGRARCHVAAPAGNRRAPARAGARWVADRRRGRRRGVRRCGSPHRAGGAAGPPPATTEVAQGRTWHRVDGAGAAPAPLDAGVLEHRRDAMAATGWEGPPALRDGGRRAGAATLVRRERAPRAQAALSRAGGEEPAALGQTDERRRLQPAGSP